MKPFLTAALCGLLSTAAVAQTNTNTNANTNTTTPNAGIINTTPARPAVTTPGAPVPATAGLNPNTGTAQGAGMVSRNTGPAAAAGDRNQALATTDANAPQPARGRNSFTAGEARRRLERQGYTAVSGLKKDNNGIWRGSATKDNANVGVWLDYKGNIGQQ